MMCRKRINIIGMGTIIIVPYCFKALAWLYLTNNEIIKNCCVTHYQGPQIYRRIALIAVNLAARNLIFPRVTLVNIIFKKCCVAQFKLIGFVGDSLKLNNGSLIECAINTGKENTYKYH
jgi:hypothetical protein